MGNRNVDFRNFSGPIRHPLPARHDHGIRVDRPEPLVKHARVTAHIEKAIRLPMRIGQFGDDVSGDRRVPAHRLDFVFQGAKLLPLRRLDKAFEAAEHARQAPIGESVFDAMRVHDPFAPIVAGLEPPGFLSMFLDRIGIRQTPVAKLRNQPARV